MSDSTRSEYETAGSDRKLAISEQERRFALTGAEGVTIRRMESPARPSIANGVQIASYPSRSISCAAGRASAAGATVNAALRTPTSPNRITGARSSPSPER